MAFVDTWRAAIPVSLAEFADLATDSQDLTAALTAAAVLWPLREPLRSYDGDAYDAFHTVAGEQAGRLLKIIANWGEDRLAAARELAHIASDDPTFQPVLAQLIQSFNATKVLTDRLTPRVTAREGAGTYNISGAIQAALANFGGTVNIGQLTLASRSEVEELDAFLREAVTAYQLHISNAGREVPSEPYKFLYPFELKDQSIFFGRDTAIEALQKSIFKAPLTIVHAPSGAGKSSLLRAGLGARLLDNNYLPIFARSYDDPIAAIVKQIVSHGPSLPPSLLFNMSLREFLRHVIDQMGRRTQELIVVLDQFEELFTLTPPAVRMRAVQALVECLQDESLPLRMVLAIRKEFFSDLAIFESRLPTIFDNRFHLEPMTEPEIKQAIIGPVRKIDASVVYDEDLLEELVGVLATDEMDLPELQILCTSLYDCAKAANVRNISYALYEEAGGAQGILSTYLEQAMARFSALELQAAWKVLEALVDSFGHRQIANASNITRHSGQDPALIAIVLDKLAGARLLRQSDHESYELAHDYLARAVQKRVGPEQIEIKRAREALQRAVDDWRTDRQLISRERLLTFHGQREALTALDDDAKICLLLSSAWFDTGLEDWNDQVGEAIVQHIATLLADNRSVVRRYAARALGKLGRSEVKSALYAFLKKSSDLETKREAALALRRLGDTCLDELLGLLSTATEGLTWQAVVEALIQDPNPYAVAALTSNLDVESEVKRIVLLAKALEVHNDPQVVPSLVKALIRNQDQQVQQALIDSIKAFLGAIESKELSNERHIIADCQGNIAKLEEKISLYGENFVPVDAISALDDYKEKLRIHTDRLIYILGPLKILEEHRTQLRLIVSLGIEKAQQIIYNLDFPHTFDVLLSLLTDISHIDLWKDCARLLQEIYTQVWDIRTSVRDKKQYCQRIEYNMASHTRIDAPYQLSSSLIEAERNLRYNEAELQPFDESLYIAEPKLANALIWVLQHDSEAESHRDLANAFGMMGIGAFEPLVTTLCSNITSIYDDIADVFSSVVDKIKPDLEFLRQTRLHLLGLHERHLQILRILREKEAVFGHFYLPPAFKTMLSQVPHDIAEVESRLPTIEYELRSLEGRLVQPLVELFQKDVADPALGAAVEAITRLYSKDPASLPETLQRINPMLADQFQEPLKDYLQRVRTLLNQEMGSLSDTQRDTAPRIYEIRVKIQQIKWILHALGATVEDEPC